MVNDVTIAIGATSSDELHETVSSIKSNENVIDASIFKIAPEPCESGVPSAGNIRLRQPMFKGMGVDCDELHKDLSLCIQFCRQKYKQLIMLSGLFWLDCSLQSRRRRVYRFFAFQLGMRASVELPEGSVFIDYCEELGDLVYLRLFVKIGSYDDQ